MKIELEDLASPDGCLLRLGSICTRFSSRAEAEYFVELLRGRIDAVKFDSESHIKGGTSNDLNLHDHFVG